MINRIFLFVVFSSYLFFGYHQIFLGLSAGAILILISSFNASLKKNKTTKFLFYNFLVAILFSVLLSIVNEGFIFEKILSFFWILVVFYFSYNFSLSNLDAVKNIYFLVVSMSLFVGIAQSININIFWELRSFFPLINDEMINEQISMRSDPPGLAYYNVQLSYQVTSLIVLYNLFIAKFSNFRKGLIINIVFCISAFLTGMTSTLVVAFSMIIIRFYVYSKSLYKIYFLILFFIVFSIMYLNFFVLLDGTKLSRVTFSLIGILIIINHPFGVAIENLYTVKSETIRSILENMPLMDYILNTSFHNTFINIGVELGLIGLLVYVFIYFKNIKMLQNYLLDDKEKLMIFLLITAYALQFITHNSGPFTGDPYYWIIMGIFLAYLKTRTNPFRK